MSDASKRGHGLWMAKKRGHAAAASHTPADLRSSLCVDTQHSKAIFTYKR